MKRKDMIRAEIERRFWSYGTPLHDEEVTTKVDEILDIIENALSEEPDKSKEEAAEEFAEGEWDGVAVDTDGNLLYAQGEIEYAFKAGAEWQKQQMLKDAVEGTYAVTTVGHFAFFPDKPIKDLCFGDKVRIIVMKEEEQI